MNETAGRDITQDEFLSCVNQEYMMKLNEFRHLYEIKLSLLDMYYISDDLIEAIDNELETFYIQLLYAPRCRLDTTNSE